MEGLSAFLKDLGVRATRLSKRIEVYQQLVDGGVARTYERGQELSKLQGLVAAFPDSDTRKKLSDWVHAEVSAVEALKEEFRFKFGRALAAGLEGSGIVLRGQLPNLRAGLFAVRADFESGTATVFWGAEVEKLKSGVKLVPHELARTLRLWHESLKSQERTPTREILSRMQQAYRRVCQFSGVGDGTRVPLVDLLAEMVLLMQPSGFRADPTREKFVEYPRVRFSYDLFRLKRDGAFDSGSTRLKLHVANFDATTKKARALWVPDSDEGDGTYYSYASFVSLAERSGETA